MIKQILLAAPVFLFCLLFVTCKKENSDLRIEKKTVAVTNVLATAPFDVYNRKDWLFKVNNNTYGINISTNKIFAQEIEQPHKLEYYIENGEFIPLALSKRPHIYFYSPNYFSKYSLSATMPRDVGPIMPNIFDQSTATNLRNADALEGIYEGMPSSHLQDIYLTHSNALLDFQITNLPADAQLRVLLGKIKPYQVYDGYFKCVVFPQTNGTISIRIGDNLYTTTPVLKEGEYFMPDHKYTFSINFNANKSEQVLEGLVIKKWSEDKTAL